MTVLIAAVVGGFLVLIIAIIGVFCFVRKVHKNTTPGNTPMNSRPTSQQEQAEMTSVRALNSGQDPASLLVFCLLILFVIVVTCWYSGH